MVKFHYATRISEVLNDYCSIMKARIDELDFELMEELAASNEPNDKLVALAFCTVMQET